MLLGIAGGLAKRGHSVTIATFDQLDSKPFYEVPSGVELLHLGVGDSERETNAREFVGRIRALARLARRLKPQVAIGFMHSAYVALGIALARSRVRVVGSEHTVFAHYHGRRWQRLAMYLAVNLLQAMTAVSERMRSTFPPFMRRKMWVVANPVVIPRRSADVLGAATNIVLSVGRLHPEKDHQTLIAAFARIAGRFPHWRLRIVGDGPLRAELEAQVRALGLEDVVSLSGAVGAIGAEYAAGQLFVLPSRYESFGLATAEAMSHALPVIGFSDCPGTNELIEDGVNGMLVESDDRAAGLAVAMSELMESPETRSRLGQKARRSVTSLSLDEVISRWELFLSQVAAGRAHPPMG